MGISIKDAPVVGSVSGQEKIPVSDGSGQPKSTTTNQIKDYATKGMATQEDLKKKQDSIEDLAAIRSGAAKGATALQSYEEQYKGTVTGVKINGNTKNPSNGVVDLGTVITEHQDLSGYQPKLVSGTNIKTINGKSILGSGNIVIEGGSGGGSVDLTGYATEDWVNGKLTDKVDKVDGKQLSTEDFTTALKTKLDGLSNYDDTTISEAVEKLRTDFDTLVSGDTATAIESFNEIIAFLSGIEDSQSLDSIIASIQQQIASKQDEITDLETIRQGAAKGATALQEHQDISHLASKDDIITVTNGDGTKYLSDSGEYKEVDALPSGGTSGQVLTKTDTGAEWQDSQGGEANVQAVEMDESVELDDVVEYLVTTEQTLTDEQKNQVKENLGISAEDIDLSDYAKTEDIPTKVSELENDAQYATNESVDEKIAAIEIPEIDTSTLATKEELNGKQDKVQIVDHGTDDTTFALTPNVLHKWGTVTSLNLTLATTDDESVANYYMAEFTSGTTATTLSVPDTITWSSDVSIEAGKTYQISILNGCGVIGGF